MVIEKIGKLPVNSRIFIDYTKTPPAIDFGYPDPDTKVVRKSDITYIISMFFAGLMILVLVILFMLYIQPRLYPNIGPSNTVINQAFITDFQYYTNGTHNGTHYGFDAILVNYTWNNKVRYAEIELSQEGSLFPVPYFTEDAHLSLNRTLFILVQALGLVFIFIILVILNTFWVAKVFKDTKWGNKKFPELNKKMHDAHYSAEFTPENFPTDKNIIEIPLFKNMYMDYDATGDFAEQLIKISITEHPFNRLTKKGNPFRKKGSIKGIHIIKKVNVYLWKCAVEFKDKPKDGSLILRWT
jgi:Na+-transporting methylmalonyl-CoA/oxaloacetate decarboxylase gamma subunit